MVVSRSGAAVDAFGRDLVAYLRFYGFPTAARTLQEELEESCPEFARDATHPTLITAQFLQAFDGGKRERFYRLWDAYVSTEHVQSETGKRLWLYTHVHFALNASHGSLQTRLALLKEFLETNGAELATSAELVPFYALPYVADPSSHPTFYRFCQREWSVRLRTELSSFLGTSIPDMATPQLQTVTTAAVSPTREKGEREETMKAFFEAETALPKMEKVKSPRLAPQSPAKKAAVVPNGDTAQGGGGPGHSRGVPVLNFAAVKAELNAESERGRRAVLLQALRWRLTKAKFGWQRSMVLSSYITNDLLGCAAGSTILATLLECPTETVRIATTRLLNTIATDSPGRTYLLGHPRLIALLLASMDAEKSDTSVHQNALGALQKFSLRRGPQTEMIALGTIEHLARILSDVDSLSEYSVEYGTALLMNLSLRSSGKARAEACPIDILSVLNDLLEYDNLQVRTYINGTLYSVLTRPALKERATAIGMEAMLSFLQKQSNEQYARQIQYILQQLAAAPEDDELSDDNADDDDDGPDYESEEELDDFEEEEEDELGDASIPGPRGEAFLRVYEAHGTTLHTKAMSMADSLDGSIYGGSPLRRPVTPSAGKLNALRNSRSSR